MFLSCPGLPGKSTGGPNLEAVARVANCPRKNAFIGISLGFTFHLEKELEATPALLQSLKQGLLRKPSLHHRVILLISPKAYREELPTHSDDVEYSPVTVHYHFLQAVTRITHRVPIR